MIEIYQNLFIGDERDYENNIRASSDWYVVQACKEPYHRRALGYTQRAAPKDHNEYLIARRDRRLILNLVDAPDPAYIPKEIIDAALEFININLTSGNRVFVHCNEGCSRSAGIGLLYLVKYTDAIPHDSFIKAETKYRSIYPPYNPKTGIRGFIIENWQEYSERNE